LATETMKNAAKRDS